MSNLNRNIVYADSLICMILYSKFKVINPKIKILFVSALDAVGELLRLFPEIKNSDISRKSVESQQLLDKIKIRTKN